MIPIKREPGGTNSLKRNGAIKRLIIPESTKGRQRQRLTEALRHYNIRLPRVTQPSRHLKTNTGDNKREGIYVDVVSAEPLFISLDKFESGTGWPSFTRPLEPDNIVEKKDRGLFTVRTEVRSKEADSHPGYLFNDGPAPTGMRYCINSAALRFIPRENLEKEGYGEYKKLFGRP